MARGKAMKVANTIFATDGQRYTKADIQHSEEAHEVKKFVDYWKKIKGSVNETRVFNCKFTIYSILDDLERDNVKFITLRKRYASLIKETLELPEAEWEKVYVLIPRRKYKNVSVHYPCSTGLTVRCVMQIKSSNMVTALHKNTIL